MLTGEQHERAVEAAVNECARLLNDDVDGNDAAKEAIDAYHRSLREQDVVLVDLREVVTALREWVKYREDRLPHYSNRTQRADGEAWVLDALEAKLDDLSERRFGGNERSE